MKSNSSTEPWGTQGFPRVQCLDPSSSPLTPLNWDPSSLTIAMLMTPSSTSHFNQMIPQQLHVSQAVWLISRHGWGNFTCSSNWLRLSFSSSLPICLYSTTSLSS